MLPVLSRILDWGVLLSSQAQVVETQLVVGLFVVKTFGAVFVQLIWVPSAPRLRMHPDSSAAAVFVVLLSHHHVEM